MKIKNIVAVFIAVLTVYGCDDSRKESLCGDNFVDLYEDCDGASLNGQTCQTMGFHKGTLKCSGVCTFDTSGCSETCGDGGIQSEYEDCDGDNLGQATCEKLGYNGGTLKCNDSCKFDVSSCEATGRCGDGILQDEYEDCEEDNLNGSTCISLGYYGGVLGCTDNCRYDIQGCASVGKCGDGLIQSDYAEECDGDNLNNQTCRSLGYNGGELSCNSSCKLDTSSCEASGICGDNMVQSEYEDCDGDNLNSETCASLGYYAGTLSCNDECSFDISLCQRCGDGIVQEGREECDGTDFLISDCLNLGYQPDPLTVCLNDCTIDRSGCKTKWSKISGHSGYTCGIKVDGSLFCWGQNSSGELGLGNVGGSYNFPQQVGSDSDWVYIAAGGSHTCAIKSNNAMYCWGADSYGQLGTGDATEFNPTPQYVGLTADWSKVATTYRYTCAINNSGKLYCWGYGDGGILGLGDTDDYDTPQQVGSDSDWAQISISMYFACAIKTDGSLYCWGDNQYGELGTDDYTNYNTPQQVGSTSDWAQVSTGYDHTCAIKTDGSLYCWGDNSSSQLGNGDNAGSATPLQIGPDSDWAYVSAGYHFNCAIKTDGSLYCWGYNQFGELGTGNTTPLYTPRQIGSDTNWEYLLTGGYHTCSTKTDGSLYCWGYNLDGELGTGDNTDYQQPTRVNY